MNVCVDARIQSGQGGVEQVVIGLAAGLSRLSDGPETYSFLTYSGEDGWLRPFISGPCQILAINKPLHTQLGANRLRMVPGIAALRRRRGFRARQSDGFIEQQGMHVMHFTTPNAFLTHVPSIYQPHDLQHVHYPHFFSAAERKHREALYRTHCDAASAVVMMTNWGKMDLARHYALDAERIQVIPGAPILPVYEEHGLSCPSESVDMSETSQPFLLYPAKTWEHKNHLRLLDAVAQIQNRHGITIPLVCTGTKTSYYPTIEAHLKKLGLEESVSFPGFVSVSELTKLYASCSGMVFPSYFEGWGMPVCEAMWAGVPIACSNATSLPDLVHNTALLFDPGNSTEMADAVLELWTNNALRGQLSASAKRRVSGLTWGRSALMFRALYRKVADGCLTDEDRDLLKSSSIA